MVHEMRTIKFFVLTITVLMIWWLAEQAVDNLKGTGHITIKERLRDLGSRIHSAVGTVAVVIVLILLVRLIVEAAKYR